LKYYLRSLFRNSYNLVYYGVDSPRYGERIFIDPFGCTKFLSPVNVKSYFGGVRHASGKVFSSWPSQFIQSLDDNPVLRYSRKHFLLGESWQQSGAIDFMMENIKKSPNGASDNCRNIDDVLNRFHELDMAWQEVQSMGRLKTRKEINPKNFREIGGILIHLGPGGEPIFSGAGCHRFAMALALGKPFPAQLGCVHITALEALTHYRKPPAN